MDESALQARLGRIERRQSYLIALLAGLYLFGGLGVLVLAVDAVTVWHAIVALVVVGLVAAAVGTTRRRANRA